MPDAALYRECLRGFVNTWECDEMGHMNVRFYISRALDGVASLANQWGLGPARLRGLGIQLKPRDQHIRFHREMRPGLACHMAGALLTRDERSFTIYQELRRSQDDAICATFRSQIQAVHQEDGRAVALDAIDGLQLPDSLAEVPAAGTPRGMKLRAPRPSPTRGEAVDAGLFKIFSGRVDPQLGNGRGEMRAEAVMGFISDGVPHFFDALGELQRDTDKSIGAAALEYRIVYRATARVGDLLSIHSGLQGVSSKATLFCHWMFDEESGRCVATSHAVAVCFDLESRRALTIPEDVRPRLEAQVVEGLRV